MASDNVTISLAANSDKLRADLKLAQAAVADFNKQLTAASREAQKTGDRTRVDELSAAYGKQADVVRVLRGEYAKLNQTAAVTATGTRNLSSHFSNLAVETKNAALAFAGLAAVRKAAGVFGEVAKEITEISNTAKAAGTTPGTVKIFTEAIRETGESADGARRSLVGLADRIARVRAEMGKAGTGGINLMRGAEGGRAGDIQLMRGGEGAQPFGAVQVMRGSEKILGTVDEVVKRIDQNAARFPDLRDQLRSILQDLGKLSKLDQGMAVAAGKEFFGRNYANFAEAISRLAKSEDWATIEADLKAQGRWPTTEATDRVKEYNIAIDNLGDSFEKLKMAMALPLLPDVTAGINRVAALIADFDKLKAKYDELKDLSGIAALEDAVVGPIRRGLIGALDAIRQFGIDIPGPIGAVFTILADIVKLSVDAITGDFSGAIRDFGTLINDVFTAALGVVRAFADSVVAVVGALGRSFDWLWQQIRAASAAVSSLFGSAPAASAPIPPPGRAAGGMIRGPGSGTSDSILARLSNGEFVMRAAAVNRWGPRFMAAINNLQNPFGYHGGGLVRRRFATGGLVTAKTGDGVTVNLTFAGGGSYALRGDREIVGGLTREARRAGMLSGGRMATAVN